MKLTVSLAAVLVAVILPGTASGQDDEQPLSPVLDIVTVDQATGFAIIRWLPSSSPDVSSYVIYTYEAGTANAVDTVRSPFVTEYTHTASAARYRSVTYVVAAVDSSLNISPLSNLLATVCLSAVSDECNGRVNVTWTLYVNEAHPALGQVLHIRTGDGLFVSDVTLQAGEISHSFTGYEPETEYCFNVTSTGAGGPLSSSNKSCVTTGSEVAPGWISIEAIMVEPGGLTVSAQYDQATDMVNYRLLRYAPAVESWEQAATSAGTSGMVQFTVPDADTSAARLYRIAALNSCGTESTLSDTARNMVLAAEISGTSIGLIWNRPVYGGGELFSVWRDTGRGAERVAQSLADTTWSEDYTDFALDVTGPQVVYRVTAATTSLPAGSPEHRSSAAIIVATENIFMPNAFTPGSGDENEYFRPEFSFIPEDYDFRVYSRNGLLLFRTTDHGNGWDGSYRGSPMPPGVYLWSLRLITPSGRTEVRNGTVTILP